MSRVKGLDILIVDDNPINRSFLRQVLERERAHPLEADGGKAALEFCEQQRFDLILLDIRMPDIGGIEVSRHLRDQPGPNRETPIIILTADMSTARMQEEMPEDLIQGWLLKPVSSSVLLNYIDNLLQPNEPAPIIHSEDSPVQLETAARMVNHDWSITARLLGMLRDQLPLRMQELERLDNAGDIQAVKDLVHGLHGSAHYCGAIRLQQRARDVEQCIEQGQAYNEPLRELQQEALRVIRWIEAHLHEVEEQAGR